MTIDVDPDLLRSNLRNGPMPGVLAAIARAIDRRPGIVTRFATKDLLPARPAGTGRNHRPRPQRRWPTR